MADHLCALVDRSDVASIRGDVDELLGALAGLAERLLAMRPFVPDGRHPLPADWRCLLWVSGAEIAEIGADNTRVAEEAFTYRLV